MSTLFLDVAAGADTPVAPVWLMRQAGRYLPEYRAVKEKHGFWTMCRTPELAAEITLQPVRRFPVDAAVLFSDIMSPLPSMGARVEFSPGPVVAEPVRTADQVAALRVPEAGDIAPFVADACRLLRTECPVPLIGFGGAPLTLATYLVQGAGSTDFALFRAWLAEHPHPAHELLDKLTEVSIRYLRGQVAAGAQAVQLFDSWAGVHDPASYGEFGAPYAERVLAAVQDVPRVYLAVGSSHLEPRIARLPAEVVSVDWRLPLSERRRTLPGKVLQGNLDPAVLLAPPDVVAEKARQLVHDGLGGPHIANLGHGVLPGTSPDAVARLVDTVHDTRRDRA